jgi:molybdopterin-containing oxidoreductase family membrane subunit
VSDQLPPAVTAKQITDDIVRPIFTPPTLPWLGALSGAAAIAGLLFLAVFLYSVEGYGVFGNNQPVNWGNDITSYIFWIGIAVAGTLVSAILFLFRQGWRTAVNRSTETMTVIAINISGLYPLIHTGRPWVDFWLMPYPNDRLLWPNLKSPILWDVFAITGYATTSIIFWYFGLIPDFATVRDRATNKWQRMVYSVLAMGWRGESRHWHHYERAYSQFAWISTPLVLGMHSTLAVLCAVGKVPGWHATIFAPYFVSGAIFGGLGMAMCLLIPMRSMLNIGHIITVDVMERLAKIMLAVGLLVLYVYGMEFFAAFYSESTYEKHQFFVFRMTGEFAWAFWLMIACNVVGPQFLWFKKVRRNLFALFLIGLGVNIGMWFERFVIVSMSVMQDHLPSAWGVYYFTPFDWMVLIGSFGIFFTLFLVFVKTIPMVSIAELKAFLLRRHHHHGEESHHG